MTASDTIDKPMPTGERDGVSGGAVAPRDGDDATSRHRGDRTDSPEESRPERPPSRLQHQRGEQHIWRHDRIKDGCGDICRGHQGQHPAWPVSPQQDGGALHDRE